MSSIPLTSWIFRALRKRKQERELTAAETWPKTQAKLLKGSTVLKDELAGGSLAQQYQLECGFYFELPGGFFGGHLRSDPCSESEARRWQERIEEGVLVTVRYDPADPDHAIAMAKDNDAALPFAIWPR
jgi:hypothetical protein